MEEITDVYEMPTNTDYEIADKIESLAWLIREDWSDPRTEVKEIIKLCKMLK